MSKDGNMDGKPITSIDDLLDSRARDIARECGLDIKDIYPAFIQIGEEIVAKGKVPIVEFDSTGSTLNSYLDCLRNYAAVAIVFYEQTQRSKVILPSEEEVKGAKVIGPVTIVAFDTHYKCLPRAVPIKRCNIVGNIYRVRIDSVKEAQARYLERMVERD